MYKITHQLVPEYLSNTIPTDPNPNRYNTRHSSDLPHFRARTELFDNSFFPSTTRLWNSLPLDIRNSNSLRDFKNHIKVDVPRSVKQANLYYVGNRFAAVQHARLRMGRSQLNAHLHTIGLLDTPDCRCRQGVENVWHYFFTCPYYIIQRDHLHALVTNYASFSLETVLFGASTCPFETNKQIFLAVQEYIVKTKRFQPGAIT